MLPAQIAWQQINVPTKIACGAREPKWVGNSLTFSVRSRHRYIKVTYKPGLDLYEVEYVRLISGSSKLESLESLEDVYADQLSLVIYRMVNK